MKKKSELNQSFLNMSATTHGFNVRVKAKGHEIGTHFSDLKMALKYRNAIYFQNGIQPQNLCIQYIKQEIEFHATKVISKSGKEMERYVVHERDLLTYAYKPKAFYISSVTSDKRALAQARRYHREYARKINRIIRLYNHERVKWFKKSMNEEVKTLNRCIDTPLSVDLKLWAICALHQ